MTDTLYEYYNASNDAYTGVYGTKYVAQTFTVGETGHTVTSVKLLLYRYSSPGTLYVSIRAVDGDGKPTGSDLTTGTTDGDTLPTGTPYEWREITLTEYTLTANTQYAIVWHIAPEITMPEVRIRLKNSDVYSGGVSLRSTNSGSTWTVYTQDGT